MHPRLLTTPYFTLYTFGVFLAAAYLAALLWITRAARRENIDSERVMSLGLWAILGSIAGAKLMMVLRTLPDYIQDPSQLWSLATLQSAGDFYGGFLGALAAVTFYFRRTPELPVWRSADLCAPGIALGQSIGRIGCFMAGDDYGSASSVPWAVAFEDPEAANVGGAPLGIPLHPVQLYESAVYLALFFALVWLRKRRLFHGQVVLAYSMGYAAARFILEYYRGDTDRGFVFGGSLSISQLIAFLVAVSCLILYPILRNKRPSST
jgi:phosphatidylglycerol:prolipoprotein diacylglycerol transferase